MIEPHSESSFQAWMFGLTIVGLLLLVGVIHSFYRDWQQGKKQDKERHDVDSH